MMRTRRFARAFTLVEAMIVIAIGAILVTLAGPSLVEYIAVQRLKGATAELVTDLQYARTEAISRGRNVWVNFQLPADGSPLSCYTLYTDSNSAPNDQRGRCNCKQPAGSRCQASATELKTVQMAGSQSLRLQIDTSALPNDFAFDHITGAMYVQPVDVSAPVPTAFAVEATLGGSRTLRTRVTLAGRPSVCLPAGAAVSGGYPACS